MGKLKDYGTLEDDMGSIQNKVGELRQGLKDSVKDAATKNPIGAAAQGLSRMYKDANVRLPEKTDPRDKDIYTADKGQPPSPDEGPTKGKKKGGCVKMKSGGSVGSASKRADGCAVRGKTKGRIV